ncbi:MAG: hypothetical protein IID40_12925 [Planctomycetes bacterium]|nr:hypothetical protein [Planctomycetota bacterium]
MLTLRKRACVAGCMLVAILSLIYGCTTTSSGIDLAVRGGLTMEISQTGTATAKVTARVVNTLGGPNMILTSDQGLTVNASGLTVGPFTGEYTANLTAADAYVITFRDQGETASLTVLQQTDLDEIGVSGGAEELTVTWAPSGEAEVSVAVSIDGRTKLTTSDSGLLTLGPDDLEDLDSGLHTVTVRRFRTVTVSPAFDGLLDRAEVSVGTQSEVEVAF